MFKTVLQLFHMKLNAVGITSHNLSQTVGFYSLLGFEFPEIKADEQHVEPITAEGSTRLMIDTAELITKLNGEEPKPGNHSSFAIEYDTAKEIDDIVQTIKDAGFNVVKEPWNAFWGQRYAVVEDPDGYKVDLYAYL